MKLKHLCIAALCCAFGAAQVQAQPATLNTFQAQDIFQLEHVSDVQISPNGEQVVYVRSGYDVMKDNSRKSLWLYDLDSNQHYPLFADQFKYTQPRWSPDSEQIAFVSNSTGKGQLHVYWLEQGKQAVLTQLDKPIANISWSPDGQQLAFTMAVAQGKSDFAKSVVMPAKPKGAKWSKPMKVIDKARYQKDGAGMLEPSFSHVFVVPASGGTPRQLTQADYQHQGPLSWTPDSSAVVFSSDQHPDWEYRTTEADLYQVKLSNGQLTQLTNEAGWESKAQFSTSGKSLAYLSRASAPVPFININLKLKTLNSGKTKNLTASFDRSIANYAWSGKGDFVIQYDDKGYRKLAKLNRSGKQNLLTDALGGTYLGRPYASGSFTMAKSGEIAFTKASSQRPADLAVIKRGKIQQLTQLNEDLLAHKTLGQVNEFNFTSEFDQQPIQGWYITPPDFDKSQQYPLIIEIHGGPHLAYGPHFSAELQRYAAQGYVVAYINYRGSTSYGADFALLLDGKYSSKEDFADQNSAVDAMIAKGFIDKNNLFIAGGSAGGIATAYAIGLTDRFTAAAITKPVINWLSKVLTADSYLYQIEHQFPGMPWDHVAHYWQRSPLSLVANVTTPALIMTGEQDRRTPMSESEQFYQALKLRKVDTVLVRVPGAAHSIASKPSRMIGKIEHTIAWFERYRTQPTAQ